MSHFVEAQKQAKEEQPRKFALWDAGRKYLQAKAKKAVNSVVRNYGDSDNTDVPVLPIKELKRHLDSSCQWIWVSHY
jgi:hypothetical protein